MKVRQGWVSNSSTSSFVLLGFNIGDMPIDFEGRSTLPTEYDYLDFTGDDSVYIVGKYIARFTDETYLESDEIDIVKMLESVTKLRDEYKPDAKILVYMGTEMS